MSRGLPIPRNRGGTLAAGLGLALAIATTWIAVGPGSSQRKLATAPAGRAVAIQGPSRLEGRYGRVPLTFIENRGQITGPVDYYLRGKDKTVFFNGEGLTFMLSRQGPGAGAERRADPRAAQTLPDWVLKLDFVGNSPGIKPVGRDPSPTIVSHFKGANKDRWTTGVPTFNTLVYRDLWPGIDLVYSGTQSRMKYQFLVRPGRDPRRIALAYRGADGVKVDAQGRLEVVTPAGGFTDEVPTAFQETPSGRTAVSVSYRAPETRADGASVWGFTLGSYDESRALVIDPAIVVYAGFIGGSLDEEADSVAIDSAGNAYVVGTTTSSQTTFPVTVGPDLVYSSGPRDAFVAKVNPSGTALVYCGYLGGSNDEYGVAIAVDSTGAAYVGGVAVSSDFPTLVGPSLTYQGMWDAFVTKINPSGNGLVYSGYIGGMRFDQVNGIAIDAAGSAYVAGWTQSTQTSFPVKVGPDLTHNGPMTGADAFVAKVNPTGSGLDYCGFIGGAGVETADGIAVDSAGNAYVTGKTASTEPAFPVVGGPDLTYNGGANDAFIAKVNAAGTGLAYCGYIGGAGDDQSRGIALDSARNVYLSGQTSSAETSFPVKVGPDLTYNGGAYDAFVARVSTSGAGLDYCGYIGGAGDDHAASAALDGASNVYVTGWTSSTEATFPVIQGPDTTFNGGVGDAFVARVAAGGASLGYCGYIGGTGDDQGVGIAVDGAGNAFVVGRTSSTEASFATLAGPDSTYNGGPYDVFVAKVAFTGGGDVTPPVAGVVNDGSGADADLQMSTTTIQANWTGFTDPESGVAGYEWAIGTTPGGTNVQSYIPVSTAILVVNSGLTLTQGTKYYVTVRATNNAGLTTVATSDGITVDGSGPVAGTVNDGSGADIDSQVSTTTIFANWTGFSDPESGIAAYEWAIGTTPGGVNVQAFTAVGVTMAATRSGLSLSPGTIYYVTVRARNGLGATVTASSDGVQVATPDAAVPPDTAVPPPDTAVPPPDTAVPPRDTAVPPADTRPPSPDTAAPPADTRPPSSDTGAPPVDAGVPAPDGGMSAADGGMSGSDGGAAAPDSGVSPADPDVPPYDGGGPASDGGGQPSDGGEASSDGGAPAPTGLQLAVGCACTVASDRPPPATLFAIAIFVVTIVIRRRRRR